MENVVTLASRVIGFRTLNDWSASDLALLLSSCSRVYNASAAIVSFRGYGDNSLRFYDDVVKTLEPALSQYKEGPMYLKLYQQWLQLYREYLESKDKPPIPRFKTPPLPVPPLLSPMFPYSSSLGLLFAHNEQFPSMRIYRIRMASPGGISFTGLADVMREMREFFKDIWFRNRQEKTIGDLQIIEKYLSVRAEIEKLSEPEKALISDLPMLARVVHDSVNQIRQLESKKILADVSENIDFITER